MKLKSFLFLVAALAMGLAFAGCGGDDPETKYVDVNRGYAGDADAIMAAFAFADEVWLTRETELGGQTLVIPAKKTLHVNGKKVKVDASTIIVAEGTLDLNAENSVIYADATGAVLVNFTGQLDTQANQEAHYASSSGAGTAGAGLVFVKNDGAPTDTASNRYIAGPADKALQGGTKSAATAAGTTVIVLGNNTVSDGKYDTGGGTLLVTGNLDFGTGYVNNGGYLAVYGKLSGGTLDSASHVLQEAAGVTFAKTAEITGGSITNALEVLNPSTFGAATSGTLVTFGGELTAKDVLVTFAGPSKFITAPATTLKARFNKDVEFEANSAVESAQFADDAAVTGYLAVDTLSGNVTVKSGSLSTGEELTLGTGLSVILGAGGGIEFTSGGKLTGTGYEVSGAGSLLNTETSGTTVTLAANGIARQTGATSVPSIVFGGVANLVYKADATIGGFNLDISEGGSISIDGTNKAIKIASGGSITAKALAAYTDTDLYIVTNAAGSIVTGANDLADGGSLGAGSYGTLVAATNFIYSDADKAQSYFLTSGTDAAFGTISSYSPNANSGGKADAGTIVLFTSNTIGN
ncbi:MAG: hypothetical protein LBJ86_07875 [Spirochaetaceae bacterium]|jgi:hypothetical protein|nr:hypothetical protein [Spirochaetaceae bacterium]